MKFFKTKIKFMMTSYYEKYGADIKNILYLTNNCGHVYRDIEKLFRDIRKNSLIEVSYYDEVEAQFIINSNFEIIWASWSNKEIKDFIESYIIMKKLTE